MRFTTGLLIVVSWWCTLKVDFSVYFLGMENYHRVLRGCQYGKSVPIPPHIEKILDDPHQAGEPLSGSLEGVSSYHFRKNKVEYRIAFAVNEKAKIVYIIMVGKRENFYEILKRRLG